MSQIFPGDEGWYDDCFIEDNDDISVQNTIRTFDSGATRDGDRDKLDLEGFLSPTVLMEFGRYMHKHRVQPNGELRASDNWQKGIPLDAYMKSLFRHVMDLWLEHRGYNSREGIKDALCGILFNVQGYLFEILKEDYEKHT